MQSRAIESSFWLCSFTVVAISLFTCHWNQAEIEESKKLSVTRVNTGFPGLSCQCSDQLMTTISIVLATTIEDCRSGWIVCNSSSVTRALAASLCLTSGNCWLFYFHFISLNQPHLQAFPHEERDLRTRLVPKAGMRLILEHVFVYNREKTLQSKLANYSKTIEL